MGIMKDGEEEVELPDPRSISDWALCIPAGEEESPSWDE